ncbi:hypothetical protein [Kordiimonas sp. SCSIO 12610]|uniref:hypothetical protein n=1 Tax=Kordiimonas sp. SCSIO 12610 TaxID=2829597 RepID=UPI00210C3152|nr:hypothetical protein [Kordiimonas sp. SCSIO 12610]UTW56519.1 hypothetical protein KFF44_06350 [Kordiimonas sp. SCSIO 12610]
MKSIQKNSQRQYQSKSMIALLSATLLATACAEFSQQTTPPTSTEQPQSGGIVTSNDLVEQAPEAPAVPADLRLITRIGELPAQPLIEKGCGLFLWASLPERKLVFYTDTENQTALMSLDNLQTRLSNNQASGLSYLGIAGDQAFSGSGLNVRLSFTAQQTKGFTGGAIVRQATLRLKDNEGWEVVMPVAGLIGCNDA